VHGILLLRCFESAALPMMTKEFSPGLYYQFVKSDTICLKSEYLALKYAKTEQAMGLLRFYAGERVN
jgi:hypothetical protein